MRLGARAAVAVAVAAAAAQVQPLAWEPPYAEGGGPGKTRKKKKREMDDIGSPEFPLLVSKGLITQVASSPPTPSENAVNV